MTSEEASPKDLTKVKKGGGKFAAVTSLFSKYLGFGGKKDSPKKSPKPSKKEKSKCTPVEEFPGLEQTETLVPLKKVKPPPNRRRPKTALRAKTTKVAPLFLTQPDDQPDEEEVVTTQRKTAAPLVFKGPPKVMQELSNSLNSMNSKNSQESEMKAKLSVKLSASSSRSSTSDQPEVQLRNTEIVKNGKSQSCPVEIQPKVRNQRSSDVFTQRLRSHESASDGIENPTSL